MPKVSIVIPTYNQGSLLRLALESVRAQTETDWEAIVINNYSDDDTVSVIESFAEPRFHRIDFRNHGVIAASRNVGIRTATADWVAFLDSDDLWAPDKLARCLAAAGDAEAVSHPETIVADGNLRGVTKTATPERVTYRSLLFDGNCLSPTAMMAQRDVLTELGGFTEDPTLVTAEDFDLWLRMAKRGTRFAFVAAPLAQYTLHAANSSGSIARHMEASLAVLDRHAATFDNRRPLDGLLHRRARARAIYGAGRSCQRLGRPGQALGLFGRSLAAYPFSAKPLAAGALALVQLLKDRI